MQGHLSGGLDVGLQNYAQSATYAFGPVALKGDYQVRGYLGFGGAWVQPVAKALSLRLFANYSSFNTTFVEQVTAGGPGYYSEDGHGSELSFGGGARFHSAPLFGHDFDPFHFRNPDGPAWWPRLSVDWGSSTADYRTKTREMSGGYVGGVDFKSTERPAWLFYEALLPVAPKVSVYADYSREVQRASNATLNGISSSSSNGGRYQSVGLGLVIYSSWWKVRDKGRYAYVPQVGFDGQASLTLHYSQSYDLIRGLPLNQGYGLGWSQALKNGLALQLGYQIYDVQDGFFNPQAVTLTKDQHMTHTLSAGLRYAWGVWGSKGTQ